MTSDFATEQEQFADLAQTGVDRQARQCYVTNLFDELAPRYDRFNRWVSLFRDEAWRRQALALLGEQRKGVILDLAAGTGDLSHSALGLGATRVHVFDISFEMLRFAQSKLLRADPAGERVAFEQGSAHRLPFQDESIDGMVSGFAMRNVFHFLDEVLLEVYRVLRPGGRLSILELSRPRNPMLQLGFKLHMSKIMPLIGRLATGNASPFRYLYQTTMTFLTPQQFCERLQAAGFAEVSWQTHLMGGIAIHYGRKP